MKDVSTLPLNTMRVVNLGVGLASAYCARLLGDAGAHVTWVESGAGHPLRRWSASGAEVGEAGALFRFLAAGADSLLAQPNLRDDDSLVGILCERSDVILEDADGGMSSFGIHGNTFRDTHPRAIVSTITPFGTDGPWAHLPATEFTLQAWSGSMGQRGSPTREPLAVGGRTGEWTAGAVAAVGVLAAWRRALGSGLGDKLDTSIFETLCLTHLLYPVTYEALAGFPSRTGRSLPLPSIEQTKDGWVGIFPITGQQWLDFCVLVERQDWYVDETLLRRAARLEREDELIEGIHAWMSRHTTDEVIDLAAAMRIPVTPIGNGANLPSIDQLAASGMYVRNPAGFVQPRVPYTIAGIAAEPPAAAPVVGQTAVTESGSLESASVRDPMAPPRRSESDLPFAGLRIADFTVFWAGPIVGNILAALGADVIHVESVQRPDGFRTATYGDMSEGWWERAPGFQAVNANKRDITLDLSVPDGVEAAMKLIASCDVVLENFTPRVMEQFGLTYEKLKSARPDVIFVRMPAFGVNGPWRDRPGFAQTMEQLSGLAWLTGYPDLPPVIPEGLCDPVAGLHATIGLLVALLRRDRTGEGALVEVPMVAGALRIAAEQVIEYSAYGRLLNREGNTSPQAAPQGAFRSGDRDDNGVRDSWIAISVETDTQWDGLMQAFGNPEWMRSQQFATLARRRAANVYLDAALRYWCESRPADQAIKELSEAGVPAARVVMAHQQIENLQLNARGFFEEVEHPTLGRFPVPRFPTKSASMAVPWNRRHAPLLGEQSTEILSGLCGYTGEQIERLEVANVTGQRPVKAALVSKN